ncbi:unnamed protein product, partial [Ilex paraguariensis]
MRDFVFELLTGVKTKEIPITRDFISILDVVIEGRDREKGLMDVETLKEAVMTNLTLSNEYYELFEKKKEENLQEVVIMGNLYMNNTQGLTDTEAFVDKPTIDSQGLKDEETLKEAVMDNLTMNTEQQLTNESIVHQPIDDSIVLFGKKVVLMKSQNSVEKGKQISNSPEVCKEEKVWYHNIPRKPRTKRVEVSTSMDCPKESEKRKFFEGESSGTKVVKSKRVEGFMKLIGMDCTTNFEKTDSKRKFFEGESSGTKIVKPKKPRKNMPQTDPNQKPDLPVEFKNLISALGGSEPVLVIQKSLFDTDVSNQHNRLSIPINKMEEGFYLQEDEKRALDLRNGKKCGEISASLVGRTLEESEIKLRKWDMKKEHSGTNNAMYVLTQSWNTFRESNGLEAGMVVQVWSFQVNSRRWFILVNNREECSSDESNRSCDGASTSKS